MFSKKNKNHKQKSGSNTTIPNRNQLALPMNLSILFTFFQNSINQDKKKQNLFKEHSQIFGITHQRQNAFKNKTKQQKVEYYSKCLNFLDQYIRNPNLLMTASLTQFQLQTIQAQAFYKSKHMFKESWSEKIIKIRPSTKSLEIISLKLNKNPIVVHLNNYYVRQSHDSSKKGIVFQTIIPNNQLPSIRLAFQTKSYDQIKNILYKLCFECQKERFKQQLKDIIKNNKSTDSSQKTQKTSSQEKIQYKARSKLLWKKVNYQEQLKHYDSIIIDIFKEIQTQKLGQCIFKQSNRKITKRHNQYLLEQLFLMSKKSILANLYEDKLKWNKNLKEFLIIQKITQNNVEVIYQKLKYKENNYESFYLRGIHQNASLIIQKIMEGDGSNVNNYKNKILSESIQIEVLKQRISFIKVKIRISQQSDQQFAVDYLKQFNNIGLLQENNIVSQIRQYINYKERISTQQNTQQDQEQDFYTINNDNSIFQIQQSLIFQEQKIVIEQTVKVNQLQTVRSLINYLNIKHQLSSKPNPYPKNIMKKHFLFEDWKKLKDGGVTCINQNIMNQQKKVAKYLLSTLGRNILSTKSILNISLPVAIFKKQSHLQTIAKNFGYAPVLLQNVINASSLQRMKAIVVFTISIAAVGISMQKPFNPLLGQTFEGEIDKCPISLQQISHHPPISAYYMVGRGYKLIGQINTKISIGMNSVIGYSDRENILIFEDGTKVTYSIMKMIIKGIFFGDRQFNFEGKNFAYDQKNHLFAQFIVGSKRSYFSNNKFPTDYLEGKIVKVCPQFRQKFRNMGINKNLPQKEDIVEELCKIEGVWNDYIAFDGKKYIDFKTQLPCELIHKQYPLPSHSNNRLDIIKLIQEKRQQSQNYKQQIEQMQRKDRKLRQKRLNK